MQSSGRDAPRDLIYAQPPAVDAAFLAKAVLVAGATLLGASALVAATNAREMRMFNCIMATDSCNLSPSDQTEVDVQRCGVKHVSYDGPAPLPSTLKRASHTDASIR